MDVDDLLDLAVLHGKEVVQRYLLRLSPTARADLRDLLTLQKHGRTRYGVRFASRPAPRERQRMPRRGLEAFPEATYTVTYKYRSGAVARARLLQQQYMAIEIVKRRGAWEVHYDDAVPTGTAPFKDAKRFRT